MALKMACIVRCRALGKDDMKMRAACGASVRSERSRHSARSQKIALPATTAIRAAEQQQQQEQEATAGQKRVALAQPLLLPTDANEDKGQLRKFLPFSFEVEVEVGTYSPDFERDIEKHREALETALRCSIGVDTSESTNKGSLRRRRLARRGKEGREMSARYVE